MAKSLEDRIGMMVVRKYPDIGPTLTSEKFLERDGIRVRREKMNS